MFPFIRDWFRRRITDSSPSAWYKPIRATSDSNLYNAYESTEGPPNRDYTGYFSLVTGSSGYGAPQGSPFYPAIGLVQNPTISPAGMEVSGLYAPAAYIGGNQLVTTDQSVPQQELI